ncbi:ester cyclase [Siansivirga zeaxanthinifaciens]|uniref:ester cyclase n=1 Tax=Siansivirga zeaxanthinifaciens TaxID=762954 RepID=UPI0009FC6F0D|nr:ester cyclase [Siansivirga zeaxanthinifaciens]
MKTIKFSIYMLLFISVFALISCDNKTNKDIEMYSNTWYEIINNGKLELFNETNFDKDITVIMSPENLVGIESVKNYYAEYLTGFTNINFTVKDIFGQGEKIVKHWSFAGTHTGLFFGIPATNKTVNIEGVTLVKMKNGKILQEQDFLDNMLFMQQLGIISNPENLTVITNLYDAFSKGDIPTVLSLLDPQVVWNEAEGNAYADGNPYIGPNAVLEGVFSRVGNDYEYFNLADIKLHDMSNNEVLATLRYKGKLKKNGALLDAQVAHHFSLRDGKVITFQQYVDTKQLHDVNK